LIGGGTLIMNLMLLGNGVSEATVRTITLQTIVMAQLFHLFNSRSIRGNAFSSGFFTNKAVFVVTVGLIVLQLSITYLPFMRGVFGTTALTLSEWVYPVMMGLIVFVVVEIEKAVMRMIDKRKMR